jgi:hypothetical protein
MFLRAMACLAVLGLAGRTEAAEKRPFTADVMWAVQRVGTPVLSPDGTQVAYTVLEPSDEPCPERDRFKR